MPASESGRNLLQFCGSAPDGPRRGRHLIQTFPWQENASGGNGRGRERIPAASYCPPMSTRVFDARRRTFSNDGEVKSRRVRQTAPNSALPAPSTLPSDIFPTPASARRPTAAEAEFEESILGRTAPPRTMFSFSRGRRWTATSALPSRRGPAEGSVPPLRPRTSTAL